MHLREILFKYYKIFIQESVFGSVVSKMATILYRPHDADSLRLSDIFASVNYAIIGSEMACHLIDTKAIIWTNVGVLITGPMGREFNEIWIKIQQFSLYPENEFKNVISQMAAILSRPHHVNCHYKAAYGHWLTSK